MRAIIGILLAGLLLDAVLAGEAAKIVPGRRKQFVLSGKSVCRVDGRFSPRRPRRGRKVHEEKLQLQRAWKQSFFTTEAQRHRGRQRERESHQGQKQLQRSPETFYRAS